MDKITVPGKNHKSELEDHIGLARGMDIPVLKIMVKCPVDLEIESPSGLIQSRNRSEILGARYSENIVVGRIDKFIEIVKPEIGNYKIRIQPQPNANVNDT